MTLSPYVANIVSGAYASATTEQYTIATRGKAGAIIVLNVATPANGFSATMSVLGVSPSLLTWTILSAIAITAAGTQVLQIRPGLVAVANQAISAMLPATIIVQVTHTDATALTRTIDLELVG